MGQILSRKILMCRLLSFLTQKQLVNFKKSVYRSFVNTSRQHTVKSRLFHTMAPRKVILDCDPGTDDAQALMMLLAANDEVDVIAVTTVFGNTEVENAKLNALRTLQICGRLDIPVYGGADRSLTGRPPHGDHFHGVDGFGDVPDKDMPSVDLVKKPNSSSYLVEIADQLPGEITLVATGPLTNLAVALRLDQAIGSKYEELIIMGGNTQGKGNVTSSAEFNFFSDPEGAKVVLNEWKGPIIWVTKDICDDTAFDWHWYDSLVQLGTPKAKFIGRIDTTISAMRENCPKYLMWDQLAAAIAIDKSVAMETKAVYTTVEVTGELTLGQSVTDWERPKKNPNVQLVTKVDTVKYGDLVKKAFL